MSYPGEYRSCLNGRGELCRIPADETPESIFGTGELPLSGAFTFHWFEPLADGMTDHAFRVEWEMQDGWDFAQAIRRVTYLTSRRPGAERTEKSMLADVEFRKHLKTDPQLEERLMDRLQEDREAHRG